MRKTTCGLTAALAGALAATAVAAPTVPAASTAIAAPTAPAAPAPPADQQPESIPVTIQRMIAQARSALLRGKAAAAADLFEQAAEHGDYVEAEVGEVRARLWAGQFRHAVAISNAVAGEHPESAEAQALLAYIEDRSGYTAQALQRLQRERQIHPHETALMAAEAEILTDRHRARDAINRIDEWISANAAQSDVCRMRARATLVSRGDAGSAAEPPARSPCADAATDAAAALGASGWSEPATSVPPVAWGAPVIAGNGLIIDGGRRVITLRHHVESPTASIWVRNARGELRRARIEMSGARVSNSAARASAAVVRATGVGAPATATRAASTPEAATVILSLNAPFATDQSLPPESIAPENARGLCFALGFPASISTDAMLPAVTPCFAFDPHATDRALRINIPLSAGERGSPVFDAQGRLMGLADPSVDSPTPVVRTAKPLAPSTDPRFSQAAASNNGTQPTIAMPELYERLAPSVVQVLVMEQP